MFESSEEAIEANEPVSLKAAERELAKHHCRLVQVEADGRITVTNDVDEAETIECRSAAILIWLGY